MICVSDTPSQRRSRRPRHRETRDSCRASLALVRARRLQSMDIDFIASEEFDAPGAESRIVPEEQLRENSSSVPRDLPGHLARLCEARLLTADEEARLFRRMNFCKYRAAAIRAALCLAEPDAGAVSRAERYLEEAESIRDRIVKSNMRLVMSVVKKFVTPQQSFDDLLSDGIYSLMQAAEKFDYGRGFRFSTYAYRAIARNAYRKMSDRQRESARFAVNSDEVVFDVADESGSSSVYDEAWDRLRLLLARMLDRLDRRERFIIRSRYALGAHRKVRTFQYLADRLGVSKERVRQLEQRAVAKLRKLAADQQSDEFVGPAFG